MSTRLTAITPFAHLLLQGQDAESAVAVAGTVREQVFVETTERQADNPRACAGVHWALTRDIPHPRLGEFEGSASYESGNPWSTVNMMEV